MDQEKEYFPLIPRDVPKIETPNRRIQTKIPTTESIPILEKLRNYEPISMQGQPPILWDRAEMFHIYDKWGNKWIDLSSGVLVASAGHSHPKIVEAVKAQVEHHLMHNYVFPSEIRMKACEKILQFAPDYLDKVFLLTTGSEATECALKLARTYGQQQNPKKNIMVSFENAFHGRTLGAQMMGGIPGLKTWIQNLDPEIIQVPFPDGFYNEKTTFTDFLDQIKGKGINPDSICGIITETYQGGGADFLPKEYVQKLREFCNQHDILLIFDEVQAGFGRTGKKFGFQHYGVEADLVCLGKAISSGLPASGVLGRKKILDLYPPGSMTSTHTGNPLACAAIIANIEAIYEDDLVHKAEINGDILMEKLQNLVRKYDCIGVCHGKGLVAGLQIHHPNTKNPDIDLAFRCCKRIVEKGVMMFSPVGKATLKISPPLCISKEALLEAIEVIDESIQEVLEESPR